MLYQLLRPHSQQRYETEHQSPAKVNFHNAANLKTVLPSRSFLKDALPLLDIREQHMRLNISPKFLYVGAEAFNYLIEEEDSASGTLPLIRQAVDTPWARLPESRRQQRVKANMLKILWALDEGKKPGILQRQGWRLES